MLLRPLMTASCNVSSVPFSNQPLYEVSTASLSSSLAFSTPVLFFSAAAFRAEYLFCLTFRCLCPHHTCMDDISCGSGVWCLLPGVGIRSLFQFCLFCCCDRHYNKSNLSSGGGGTCLNPRQPNLDSPSLRFPSPVILGCVTLMTEPLMGRHA